MSPFYPIVDESAEVSIRRVAEMVVAASGFTGPVVYDDTKADGQFKKTASNAKLRKYLPNHKFTPIEEAIKNTVEWFDVNYETARK